MKRSVWVVLCVLVLAGCGGDRGSATLWVTRDRGEHVLLVARVPSGLTAMQALERKEDVKTSYGGRWANRVVGRADRITAMRHAAKLVR